MSYFLKCPSFVTGSLWRASGAVIVAVVWCPTLCSLVHFTQRACLWWSLDTSMRWWWRSFVFYHMCKGFHGSEQCRCVGAAQDQSALRQPFPACSNPSSRRWWGPGAAFLLKFRSACKYIYIFLKLRLCSSQRHHPKLKLLKLEMNLKNRGKNIFCFSFLE